MVGNPQQQREPQQQHDKNNKNSRTTIAANANPDLSTMLSTAGPVQEDLPVAKVSRDPLGIKVQFGGDETIGAPGDELPFAVEKNNGKAPAIKTYGSLFGCGGGTLTIEDKRYRIQVIQQQENGEKRVGFGSFIYCSFCSKHHPTHRVMCLFSRLCSQAKQAIETQLRSTPVEGPREGGSIFHQ